MKTSRRAAEFPIESFLLQSLPFAAVFLLISLSDGVLGQEVRPEQKSVLVLYSDRSDMEANIVVDQIIRSALDEALPQGVDFYSEYIDTSRFPEDFQLALHDFLGRKYARQQFDVIIAVAGTALRFVRAYGSELFPGSPIVSWGGREVVEDWGAGPPLTGVVARADPKGTLEFILRLQPDIHQLVVLSGASPVDRYFEALARHELRGETRVALRFLSGLSLGDVQEQVSSLPAGNAILFLNMAEDAEGKKLLTHQILPAISAAAAVPVYGIAASQLQGIVGGKLLSQERLTRETVELALRVLRGESVENIPIRESNSVVPMADWRQLRRWRISEARLPPGTIVQFKEPSIWNLYKWRIIGVISLCIVETLLIVALLVQRVRRKRAEVAVVRNQELLQSTIDALAAHIALLDEDGKIVAVNESWRRYAVANGFAGVGFGVGQNYLEVCESSIECEEARIVSEGIRAVMISGRPNFRRVYESSHGDREAWFQLRVNAFFSGGALRLVLAHENITEIKQAHDSQQQLTGLLLQAQDAERRRIARDLHDVTVQNLAIIKANLTRTREVSRNSEAQGQEPLGEAASLCDQVIKELRTLSYLLHPPLLDEIGLVAALQWYVRGFIQRCGIEVEILITQDIGRLPTDVEMALFRVVQESLTNIHRHSGSQTAIIRIMLEEGEIALRIKDEGRGMVVEQPPDGKELVQSLGVGIPGMRQRLRQLGGRLEIASDSQGTTVTAIAPISKEELCRAF